MILDSVRRIRMPSGCKARQTRLGLLQAKLKLIWPARVAALSIRQRPVGALRRDLGPGGAVTPQVLNCLVVILQRSHGLSSSFLISDGIGDSEKFIYINLHLTAMLSFKDSRGATECVLM